jgi:hypothetical protein
MGITQAGDASMLKSCSLSIGAVILVQLIFALASVHYSGQTTSLQEGQTQEIGIIFPPGMTQTEMIERINAAGATPLKSGAWSFIQMAIIHKTTDMKNLSDLGAVFLFTPVIRGACILKSSNKFTNV